MIRKIKVLITMVLISSASTMFAGNSEKEDATVIATENWLGIVDSDMQKKKLNGV